jgi:hypothetical protein
VRAFEQKPRRLSAQHIAAVGCSQQVRLIRLPPSKLPDDKRTRERRSRTQDGPA